GPRPRRADPRSAAATPPSWPQLARCRPAASGPPGSGRWRRSPSVGVRCLLTGFQRGHRFPVVVTQVTTEAGRPAATATKGGDVGSTATGGMPGRRRAADRWGGGTDRRTGRIGAARRWSRRPALTWLAAMLALALVAAACGGGGD